MNKARREQINEIKVRLQNCLEELETLRDEEQEYYDNMPEGLQYSERGEAAESAASNLSDACESLETIINDNLESAVE